MLFPTLFSVSTSPPDCFPSKFNFFSLAQVMSFLETPPSSDSKPPDPAPQDVLQSKAADSSSDQPSLFWRMLGLHTTILNRSPGSCYTFHHSSARLNHRSAFHQTQRLVFPLLPDTIELVAIASVRVWSNLICPRVSLSDLNSLNILFLKFDKLASRFLWKRLTDGGLSFVWWPPRLHVLFFVDQKLTCRSKPYLTHTRIVTGFSSDLSEPSHVHSGSLSPSPSSIHAGKCLQSD